MSLKVVEIFPALQGEGATMGYPSVFVRLGGCNLTCEGFGCTAKSPIDGTEIKGCDSIHAVNVKHFKGTWDSYKSFKPFVYEINKHISNDGMWEDKPQIVLTGGEPILHHKNQVLIDMIEYYLSRGHEVMIETNGTIEIDFDKYPTYKKVFFSISAKMSNSGEDIGKRWKFEVVDSYIKNTKGSYFKFVIAHQHQIIEVKEYLSNVPTFAPVYIMPQGETREEVQKTAWLAYETAFENGYRYSDRLHIRIYSNEKLR